MDTIHRVACKVSGGSLPDGYSVTLDVELDYAGVSTAQERAWASRTCVINLQRNLRTQSTQSLNKLALAPYRVSAIDCGKKVVSREDKIKKYTSMGLTPEVAVLAVDNPEAFNKLMGDVKVG